MVTFNVINGPNLNRLGKREPKIYGCQTWDAVWETLREWTEKNEVKVTYFQSNHEGALIDRLQVAEEKADGILLNPGAYAHTSIALLDCVASLSIPVVEVHITNIRKRESFRTESLLQGAVSGFIAGFGTKGYLLGLVLLKNLIQFKGFDERTQ